MEAEMLKEFYQRYSREIYLYLYSLCKSREIAEDIMQEVFLKALLSLESSSEGLRPWLYKVARNTLFHYLRKTKRESLLNEAITENSQHPPLPEKLIADERRQVLYRGMLTLPARQREILELFYFSDMRVREIASLLNLTQENVRVLAHRAKKTLKKYMEVNGYDL